MAPNIAIIICLLYDFGGSLFAARVSVIIIMACYICYQLLFSVRIVRTTHLNRIVDTPDNLVATLSMGLTFDHVVSMQVPLGGGLLWAH